MDLIDRKAMLKHIEKIRQDALMMDDIRESNIIMMGMNLCEEAVRNQPSAQPEPKKGKWIRDECGELYCSECGRYTEDRHDMISEFEGMKCIALVPPNFCGYCGAYMRGEKQ